MCIVRVTETCPLSEPHAPKEGSLEAFEHLLPEIRKALVHLRHNHDSLSPLPPSSSHSAPSGDCVGKAG